MNFENIPAEMRQYVQFVMWRYEDTGAKKPTKVPYSAISNRLASVTDLNTWATFEQCVEAMKSGWYNGIGFVLSESDPYAFIDLDDPYEKNADGSFKHNDPAKCLQTQLNVFNEFNSYAERSPSGTGLHIIVKAKLLSGRRRSSIEIYSSMRYMTMTGDVYRNGPISDCNEMMQVLWEQMGKTPNNTPYFLGLAEPTESDERILEIASGAANGQKFIDLFQGNWQFYYQSQSEADFALIDILAFYSHNKAQITRLFRQSGLAQREKAQREDYLNYMLNKCFDRILPPVDIDGLKNQLDAALALKQQRDAEALKAYEQSIDGQIKQPQQVKMNPSNSVYEPPPGLVGEVAKFIYSKSPRPNAEIALAGAIGLMAGITGRAYNVSGTGLNQYILLLAETGTGKESIQKGISYLVEKVTMAVPSAGQFIGPSSIASAQAITKYMSTGPCSIVSIVGEFGLEMQQMGSKNASPHLIGLRKFLLDIYNKSGKNDILGKMIYSDKDKNTNAIKAPAFTLLGESTPEKYYEGLHEGLITEGFLPRFTVIESYSSRPYYNENHQFVEAPDELIQMLSQLCAHSLTLNSHSSVIDVQYTPGAKDLLNQFNAHCDDNLRSAGREVQRNLWNRGHIKALKLAGLIAVGLNPYEPTINEDAANWAINLVVSDIRNMLKKFELGEIGTDNDESKQMAKVISGVHDFVTSAWGVVEKYADVNFKQLHSDKIIPYAFLQRKFASVAVFRNDKQGATNAIKRALKTLVERGDLQEVSKPTLVKKYNCSPVAYMIVNSKVFGI